MNPVLQTIILLPMTFWAAYQFRLAYFNRTTWPVQNAAFALLLWVVTVVVSATHFS